jgi:hypothetical protein
MKKRSARLRIREEPTGYDRGSPAPSVDMAQTEAEANQALIHVHICLTGCTRLDDVITVVADKSGLEKGRHVILINGRSKPREAGCKRLAEREIEFQRRHRSRSLGMR